MPYVIALIIIFFVVGAVSDGCNGKSAKEKNMEYRMQQEDRQRQKEVRELQRELEYEQYKRDHQ